MPSASHAQPALGQARHGPGLRLRVRQASGRVQEGLHQRLRAVGERVQWPCGRLQNGWGAFGGCTEAVGGDQTVIPEGGGGGGQQHPLQAQAKAQETEREAQENWRLAGRAYLLGGTKGGTRGTGAATQHKKTHGHNSPPRERDHRCTNTHHLSCGTSGDKCDCALGQMGTGRKKTLEGVKIFVVLCVAKCSDFCGEFKNG